MLKIEKVNDQKIYTIKNKYLCENGVLNEKNVCNACMKYMKRKCVGGVENEKDDHKTKKEKHRLNVYKKILLELNKVVDR